MKLFLTFLVLVLFSAVASAEVHVSISGGEKIESTGDVQVKIPFDEEYRINLDNKDANRRALVHVMIDGRAATGDGLVLRKGESVQLERFIDNGDLRRGPKFKFVDKDEQKRMGRAESKNDGLISVTVQYERDKEPLVKYGGSTGYASTITVPTDCRAWLFNFGCYDSRGTSGSSSTVITADTSTLTSGTISRHGAALEPGITIEGSESKQRFKETKLEELEDRIETLVIRLLGFYRQAPLLMRQR